MFEEDYERQREQDERETENFLKQLESTRSMYSDFSKTRLYQEKQMLSKETLESLLALQYYTSKAIVKVYKTFSGCLEDLHDQLKRIANDI
jgi:hypothetical protein